MYLKSIEVQGFKSFANKVKFDFHNGITGIVGPNGSGKSNVADAVRWVLGEQRVKQLRGGAMQDVIFAGTENRKPLSYATVSIVLDNSDHHLAVDYNEVVVTRRLYRSGESEYLLNGSQCRLKDINELFYDTGIGKEGYSIIGQGQIDRILSGKPEERRELFDEAAGIVKFKRRKNTAIKKLEEEKQNLLRVNDILAELEKQVGPLERQSEKAKEYLKKKDALKIYDINMFLLENQRLKSNLEQLEQKIAITEAELEKENELYDKMKEEYQSIEEEIEDIDAEIADSNSQLTKTSILKQQLENQIELTREQIRSAQLNDEHFLQRSQAIDGEISSRDEQLKTLNSEKEQMERELSALRKEEEEKQSQLVETQTQIVQLTASVEKSQSDLIELLNNRTTTTAEIQKYDTMLEQIEVRRTQLKSSVDELKAELELQKSYLLAHQKELNERTVYIQGLHEKGDALDEEIKTLQKEIAKRSEEFRIGQSAYLREQSRLESLKNITERYDGYGNSIRRVMSQKNKETGLLGVVADLIQVNKDYEVAIETALGGNIQNIVTKDENTAKKMIQYLKTNKFGRATFLPLSSIRANNGISNPDALREDGAIGTADTLVSADEKYKILVKHLLGRTLVVDHIDHGIMIARKYRQSIRIVTLEGELINPGGSMTGGAFKNTSNLLSRRREIEEFERTIRKLKAELDESEKITNQLREKRTKLYDQLEAVNEELRKEYVKQNTAKMNVEQTQSFINNSGGRVKELQKEALTLDEQWNSIVENQESISVELDTSEHLESDINTKLENMQKEMEVLREQEAQQQAKTEELHLSTASYEQKFEFTYENIQRVTEELEKFHIELEELKKTRNQSSGEISGKEAQILDYQNAIDNSKELFEEIEEEIEALKIKKETLAAKNKSFLDDREEKSKHISSLDKEMYRLESQKNLAETNIQNQIDYMWDEYGLTYHRALELRDENLTNLAQMKRKIAEIKAEIKALGNVNVNAIEEYKEVSERYTFMKTQHDDLVTAEESLEKIITELDAAMRKQFTEQFALINTEFNKVFKELFGGGKGTLELVEDQDVLEAGIRVIAQPPGKKLQNMMQLSGGEKALTAISLLFAIQNLKPSPFCLLDEIEAALDDSNVVRFAKYLHKLTKHTQFIVITHRRGTMTLADRLYGITMQEKGISTLVSVSLIEDELSK